MCEDGKLEGGSGLRTCSVGSLAGPFLLEELMGAAINSSLGKVTLAEASRSVGD